MTTRMLWSMVALVVVLLSMVATSKVECPSGYMVITAENRHSTAVSNTPAGPKVECFICVVMVISANTQTQIIFTCRFALAELLHGMFADQERKKVVPNANSRFVWKDRPRTGEAASLTYTQYHPDIMTFKDALDAHEKLFPPSSASSVVGFHCYDDEFKSKTKKTTHRMIYGHIRPMHIESAVSTLSKCFVKVIAPTKGEWEWHKGVLTIKYGSMHLGDCPKTRCEQSEDGKSGICCCDGSLCNNAPLMYAMLWIATAPKPVRTTTTLVTSAPPTTTAALTTSTTTSKTTTITTKPSTTTEKATVETPTTANGATTITIKPNTATVKKTTSSVTTAGENMVILWAALITISVLLLLALLALMVVICILLRRQKGATKKQNDPTVVVLGQDGSYRLSKKAAWDEEKSATTTEDAPQSKPYTN